MITLGHTKSDTINLMITITSDRPKFGSVPVPAKIVTWTDISVSVPAKFQISVSAEISVQTWTENVQRINCPEIANNCLKISKKIDIFLPL